MHQRKLMIPRANEVATWKNVRDCQIPSICTDQLVLAIGRLVGETGQGVCRAT